MKTIKNILLLSLVVLIVSLIMLVTNSIIPGQIAMFLPIFMAGFIKVFSMEL